MYIYIYIEREREDRERIEEVDIETTTYGNFQFLANAITGPMIYLFF